MIYQFGANGRIFVRKGERERSAVPGAFSSDVVPGGALQIGASGTRLVCRQHCEEVRPAGQNWTL
jgi:hypothetical protein